MKFRTMFLLKEWLRDTDGLRIYAYTNRHPGPQSEYGRVHLSRSETPRVKIRQPVLLLYWYLHGREWR